MDNYSFAKKMFPHEVLSYLDEAVNNRQSILICGDEFSGKTTLLRYLVEIARAKNIEVEMYTRNQAIADNTKQKFLSVFPPKQLMRAYWAVDDLSQKDIQQINYKPKGILVGKVPAFLLPKLRPFFDVSVFTRRLSNGRKGIAALIHPKSIEFFSSELLDIPFMEILFNSLKHEDMR